MMNDIKEMVSCSKEKMLEWTKGNRILCEICLKDTDNFVVKRMMTLILEQGSCINRQVLIVDRGLTLGMLQGEVLPGYVSRMTKLADVLFTEIVKLGKMQDVAGRFLEKLSS